MEAQARGCYYGSSDSLLDAYANTTVCLDQGQRHFLKGPHGEQKTVAVLG